MNLFRNLSIRKKLMASMVGCQVLFLVISTALSFLLIGNTLRERAVEQELPAVVGEIRNDLLRQISAPLATSQAIASNTFLLDWEAKGLHDEGATAWKQYATRIQEQTHAASVFWVSADTGKYFTAKGLDRTLSRDNASDQWFYGLLSSSKPYTLDIDKDKGANSYMLFINARFDAGGGKMGYAGLGLAVSKLADAVRNYRVGNSGTVALVRANGTLLVHRDPALVEAKTALKDLPGFSADLAKQLLGGQPFFHTTYNAPTGKTIVVSSFVPELDLYVVAEVPETEVLGKAMQSVTWSALIAGVLGAGIGLILIFWISTAIAAPVGRAALMLGQIADGDGDLSRRMPVETGDEVGALATSFNRFVSSLENMVGTIRLAADSISVASSEVAQGNMDLSNRTEQTASALQQTASALDSITHSVQLNTESTRSAGQLAQNAHSVAERGGAAVSQVVETMESINASSRKISDIIAVIDGIAFQTNILALNAAVEAARAGEQGRGFAVVASEVRALAQRSATAAKEIRGLITASVEQVASGSEQVQQAGTTMTELLASVSKVTRLIEEISDSSVRQGQSISGINQSIANLDSATQQNSALVEESAAAAASLREQAQRLLNEVAAFKLGDDSRSMGA